MLLTSSAFQDGGFIPKKFTCDGGNINPELLIQNVPPDAQSLALIMHDPDAPSGGFTHWVVWNINPATSVIKEESVPPGASEGITGRGNIGYVGPCPPSGTHRYQFRLYALDEQLVLSGATTASALEAEVEKHLLATAELVGLYKR